MPDYSINAVFSAIDNMSGVLGNIGANFTGMGSQMLEGALNGEEGFGAMDAAAGIAMIGVGALFEVVSAGIAVWQQTDEAMAGVAARTGLTGSALDQLKTTAQDVFMTGLVPDMNAAVAAAAALHQWVTGLPDQKSTDEFMREAAGVASAWGESADKVVTDTGKFQKVFADLKNDPTTALNILTKVAQDTGIPFQSISDIVDKYGPKFAAAGVSALGMGGMIVLATQAGIGPIGLGALGTAVDSFHNKILNPPASFEAALKKLGLGDEAKELSTNKITMDQALSDVFTAISNIQDPAQKSQVAIALFGTGIDKIGGADALGKLAGFSDALGGPNGVAGAASNAADAMENTFGAAVSRTWNKIATDVSNGADAIYQGLSSLFDNAGPKLDDFFNKVADTFQNIFDIIGVWLNNASKTITEKLNDFVTAVGAFAGQILKGVHAAIDPVIGVFQGLLDIINNIINGIGNIGAHSGGFSGGGGGGGGSGGGASGSHATGGFLGAGWNLVGEAGPELILGSTGQVFPIGGASGGSVAPSSGGGSGSQIKHYHFDLGSGTVVDMAAFVQQVKLALDRETVRRGGTA